MADLDNIMQELRERDRILEDGDIPGMRKLIHRDAEVMGFPPPADELIETIFHKVRYEATGVSRDKRLQSGDWLRATGHHRVTGTPVLPQDQLPE